MHQLLKEKVSCYIPSGLKSTRGRGWPFGRRTEGSQSSSKKGCAHASSYIYTYTYKEETINNSSTAIAC